MEGGALDAALTALLTILDPARLVILAVGVFIGLALGVIPGLGGIVGLAILIPFTYGLDPYAAFALLVGMAAVTTTSDTIPAVLFGVPGTAGSAATVIDGHPLAKRGEAGRAFGAAYAASVFGGVAGAVLLALSIPVLRPIILYLGSPELLALVVFGLSMVAVLSGGAPFKGLAAAAVGLMLAMVGGGPQTGTLRWTFDTLYLWDGLPLVPVTLGLFALPELAELVVRRSKVARNAKTTDYSLTGQWAGVRDTARNWWLVLRCSWLGAALGAVPGIGSAVIDWIAYGHAARTEKSTEGFGEGDIRGVIAPESANNAKDGGALVPTIAFGVPGSASMALLLGAFLMHGLIPGPEMLTRHLDVTYAIIWSLALANILGAAICILASGRLARLAEARYGLLVPTVLAVAFIGAFQGSRSWGDLFVLLAFGIAGWQMKRLGWPRPPLILGFVLGDLFERYLFISTGRYGADWLSRPVVVIVLLLALWGLYRPLRRSLAGALAGLSLARPPRMRADASTAFAVTILALLAFALYLSTGWPAGARIVPQTAGTAAALFTVAALATDLLTPTAKARRGATPMDLASVAEEDTDGEGTVLTRRLVARRATVYFAWLALFLGLGATIGLVPAVPAFIALFGRFHARERWRLVLPTALGAGAACWLVFDLLLKLPWPHSLLGNLVPALRDLTGLV